jgi:hypothetical protein
LKFLYGIEEQPPYLLDLCAVVSGAIQHPKPFQEDDLSLRIHHHTFCSHCTIQAKIMLFTSAAVRSLGRSSSLLPRSWQLATTKSSTTTAIAVRSLASLGEQFDEYGKAVFTGAVAEEYLSKHGGSAALLKDPTWVNHSSDTVANAVFDWYVCVYLCINWMVLDCAVVSIVVIHSCWERVRVIQ